MFGEGLAGTFCGKAPFRPVYWSAKGLARRLSFLAGRAGASPRTRGDGRTVGLSGVVATALACLVACLLSAATTALILRYGERLPAAAPNERSLHGHPVPRVGGLALWAGFLPVGLWLAPALPGGLAGWPPAWLAIAAVSLLDDARGAPVLARLAVQVVAAVWSAAWILRMPGALMPGVTPDTGYVVAVIVAALAIAWSCNLYNFMDGSDGLAGAMTLVGFATLGLAAWDDPALRTAALAVSAACLPFLVVNRPPARVFLGDVGAVPAGFLAAVFSIGGMVQGLWPAWFPLLVFLPFLADATATLARRLLRGERVWVAHRSHYYQRLHQLGAGHAGTLALYLVAAVACAATALACRALAPSAGAAALAAWCAVFAVLFAAIDYHWRHKPSATR